MSLKTPLAIPKTEIKQEVFIITEVIEKPLHSISSPATFVVEEIKDSTPPKTRSPKRRSPPVENEKTAKSPAKKLRIIERKSESPEDKPLVRTSARLRTLPKKKEKANLSEPQQEQEVELQQATESSNEKTAQQDQHVAGKKRVVCDQCPRSFKKHSLLIEHKRLHTGEKPFTCDQCGKQFSRRTRLTEHKRRHSNERKFTCEICNLGCYTKRELNTHMRRHNNDRRFQCTTCHKAFVCSSDLKIHLRVHTGEKPYICDICHKCFRASQTLSVHKKSHMGEESKTYKCEHCDKMFNRNIDRKVHMRSHTGERPFKCDICDRAYSSRFNMRAHIERNHMSDNDVGTAHKVKKKPTSKQKALTDKLEKQRKLVEKLEAQLKREFKTDEDTIIDEHSMDDSCHEENLMEATDTTPEGFEIIYSPPSMALTDIPAPPCLDNNPFTKSQKKPATAPATIMQKLEQHTSSSSICSMTSSPQNQQITTKLVSQKTSLGIQQVSVTVSVENAATSTAMPEKENTSISNMQITAKQVPATSICVKEERKITSYFAVLGQKAGV